MNINDYVMIVDHEKYDGHAAEIISVYNYTYTVKLLKSGEELELDQSKLKRRKVCVCGQTSRGPWCDGSHSRH